VGWTASDTDNGYVAPDAFASGDIICHKSATNAGGHAQVAAGSSISIQWSSWPESHHGPVIDYLANCGDSCETVDKTTLEFFKIDGVGLVDDTSVPGTWGSDQLIANNNSWLVEIPSTIAPGNYVLRHEIIALHGAESSDGAQNYPQCFNLQVTGTGTDSPTGTLGEALYSESDAGILVNIYQSLSTYEVPGPTMYTGAVSVAQSSSAITSTGTATTGSATATAAAAGTTSTLAAAAATTKASSSSAAAAATTKKASTSAAATKAATTSAAAAATTSKTSAAAAATTSKSSSCKKRRHARDVQAQA
jgi:lytic cellulose monooxygenase (C1-hydroxylating)